MKAPPDQALVDDVKEVAEQMSFGELRDLERREEQGDALTAQQRAVLAYARRRTKPLGDAMKAYLTEYQREYGYVATLSVERRKKFEHMTMQEIRRVMRRECSSHAPVGTARPRARARGAGRPRRQATRSSAASGDGPDEPEPAPPAPDRSAAHRVALSWLYSGAEILDAEEAGR